MKDKGKVNKGFKKNKSKKLDTLIAAGSEIAGNATATSIGLILAGPPGAFAGSVVAPVLTRLFKKMGKEIKERVLSSREEVRIGATFIFAINKIKTKIKLGNAIRDDDFFEKKENNRSDAEEILEGVLLSAQKEPEERKINFVGNLYANIAFDKRIDKYYANLFIKIVQQLTYRQLCIISLFKNSKENPVFLKREKEIEEDEWLQVPIPNLYTPLEYYKPDLSLEFRDLEQKGILKCDGHYGKVNDSYSHISIKEMGTKLVDLMELGDISENDILYLEEILRLSS